MSSSDFKLFFGLGIWQHPAGESQTGHDSNSGALWNRQPPIGRLPWACTGGAGFIGSHVAETLLKVDHRVLIIADLLRAR
jgi:hypothetical protein